MPSEPVPAKAARSPPDLLLPNRKARLKDQLSQVQALHQQDLANGFGHVHMASGLARK
ncbi:MAG: hypothetical protein KGR98_08270 [Verrucomicrobia bacterium]|nr:hypothetical protein [Verrucomicrobiota bacterium]MDE3099244.1 hypothetical protein [Verrucomicrobiota bacterium]